MFQKRTFCLFWPLTVIGYCFLAVAWTKFFDNFSSKYVIFFLFHLYTFPLPFCLALQLVRCYVMQYISYQRCFINHLRVHGIFCNNWATSMVALGVWRLYRAHGLHTWGKCSLASDVQRTTVLRTRIKGFALPSVRLSFSINAMSWRCYYGTDIGWKDLCITLEGYFWTKKFFFLKKRIKQCDILKNREVCFVFSQLWERKMAGTWELLWKHILDNEQLKPSSWPNCMSYTG